MPGRAFALLAAFAVLPAACTQARPAAPEGERMRLERSQERFVSALSDRDADGLAELFAEDAVVHVANMPAIEGRADIRRFYANMFDFLAESASVPVVTRMSEGGDMAYATGSARNTFRSPAGEVSYSGKWSLVWRRIDGEWRVVLYAVSSDEPAEGG